MKEQNEISQGKKLQQSAEDLKVNNFITRLKKEQARQIFGGRRMGLDPMG